MAETAPSSPPPAPARVPRAWFVAGTVLLLAALGYLTIAGSLRAPFSEYDDVERVVENPLLQPQVSWAAAFTEFHSTQYTPLTFLSFRLNGQVCGFEAAWTFRLVNWLIHAAGGLALLWVLGQLGLSRLAALFIAAAWTAHPLACESVAWITERSNCLAFLCGILGLGAYLRGFGSWKGLLGAVLGLLLALLSKPSAIGWFPVFLAVELLGGPARLHEDPSANGESAASPCERPTGGILGAVLRLLPLACLCALCALIAVWREELNLLPPPGGHWYTALLTDLEIFTRYIGNILLPVYLSAFYGVRDVCSLADPRVYIYGASLAALVAGSLWAARSRRRALLGWLWFFGALAPNANLISLVFLMQDRYLYIASPGLLLVLVETVLGLAARLEKRRSFPLPTAVRGNLLPALAVCYIVLLSGLCVARGVVWGEVVDDCPVGLRAEAVRRQPGCGLAHTFYGLTQAMLAQRLQSEPQRAREASRLAVEHLVRAQDCPDNYRFFAPLQARVVLAQQAILIGQPELARHTLRAYLPPPAPEGNPKSGLSAHRVALGYRAMVGEESRIYHYRQTDVAMGCLAMALADLAEARRHPKASREAAQCAMRGRYWVARAAQYDPTNPDIPVLEQAFSAPDFPSMEELESSR